jgi:5-methylcytosine-specific restriction endonuclease McrA
MSIEATAWAMAQSTELPLEKLLLIFLADRADMDGFFRFDGCQEFTGAADRELGAAVYALLDQAHIVNEDGRFRLAYSVTPKHLVGPVPNGLRKELLAEAGGVCTACGGTDKLAIDHIIPRSRGGTNDRENLQVLCTPCNSSKGAKMPSDWKGRFLQ